MKDITTKKNKSQGCILGIFLCLYSLSLLPVVFSYFIFVSAIVFVLFFWKNKKSLT